MLKQKLLSLAAVGGLLAFFVYVCAGVLDEGHDEQVLAKEKAARWAANE